KPATGMYQRAASELGLDLADSYYVGDKVLDVTPSLVLGGVGVLVRTAYDVDESAQMPADTAVVDDLMEAARFISSRD
ncbi:MAG TPA: D,D-heptose 1,7-bisphosphate phosphatase, partial [Gemmatimonadetes bacterium]|nr:D,D-heptose 1,7-bisphosphate phosphatase [Gemmatimonadota bacterium]